AAEQADRRLDGVLDGRAGDGDEALIEGDAVRGERMAVAGKALLRREDPRFIAQESDAAMAVVDEVVDRLASAAVIVDEDAVAVDACGGAVDQDQRHAVADDPLDVPVVGGGCRGEDEAANAQRPQALDQLALLVEIFLTAGDDEIVAALAQLDFEVMG